MGHHFQREVRSGTAMVMGFVALGILLCPVAPSYAITKTEATIVDE